MPRLWCGVVIAVFALAAAGRAPDMRKDEMMKKEEAMKKAAMMKREK